MLEPESHQRHGLHGRERLHADRHLPIGRLRRREPGDLHRQRPMSPRRCLRHGNRRLLQPEQAERNGVQRRECLYPTRFMSVGCVLRLQPGELQRQQRLHDGQLRSWNRRVLESEPAQWNLVQRRERLHAERFVSVRSLHGSQRGDMHGE